MSVPHARGFLLLRRAGGVWGIASSDVEGMAVEDGGYRISAGGEAFFADSIVGVVADLRVHPPAPVLRRFWPETVAGLAVYERTPVVMVDPRYPPAILKLDD
ncbi:MAG TPA: hypothetical protein VHC97_16595 [Thermoanaerobaculia bacterium]|jgi:hypothetical protein|nr:hypothetical protein [Thermoanaerobaculia bacterium]